MSVACRGGTTGVLLRAVNVAGRQMRVTGLRALLSEPGYDAVATLLQGGHAVFTASERPDEPVAAEFGMRVTVVVRTAADLARAVDAPPFPVRGGVPGRAA